MAHCLPQKTALRAPSYLHKYPCQIEEIEEPKPCPNVVLQDLIDVILQSPEKQEQKKPARQKLPCEDVKPPSKKKFEQLGLRNICAMPYSRTWTLGEEPCRDVYKLLKSLRFQSRKQQEKSGTCPRALSEYEKSLWVPICKPLVKPPEIKCIEPIEENVCVFCLGNLYTGGTIYDLLEKVPLIKKQSEIYGDDILQRIGIRTRITVHKKCYDDYIDILSHKEEKEGEAKEVEENEESEDLNCGEEKEEVTDEEEEKKEDEKKKRKGGKRRGKVGTPLLANLNFCLRKFEVPALDPGELFIVPRKCYLLNDKRLTE